jgi:hypothetical protein
MLDPDETVAYSGALTDMKKLMDSLGFEGKLYGEHSGKRGGATTSVAHGATEKQLKRLRGWRSDAMPAKYVDRFQVVYQCQSCCRKIQILQTSSDVDLLLLRNKIKQTSTRNCFHIFFIFDHPILSNLTLNNKSKCS